MPAMPLHFRHAENPIYASQHPVVIIGTFIDAPTPYELRIRRHHFCILDRQKRIYKIEPIQDQTVQDLKYEAALNWECPEYLVEVTIMKDTQVVCVGLIDCHVHASQYGMLGTKTDLPLMEWLLKYTFPVEARFLDPVHSLKVYTSLVRRLLRNGTTTAVYYASNDSASSLILAETAAKYGQRAFVGKVCSDMNVPEYYIEDTARSLRDTEEFIQFIHDRWGKEGLVRPVVTPRFIPTCSLDLLKGLGEIAKKYDCFVQTHAAESLDEVVWVAEHDPTGHGRDIAALESIGLLRKKAILAHCCHLSDGEVAKIQEVGAGIVSCPYSNILFARSTVPITKYYSPPISDSTDVISPNPNLGLERIALGTDIAGGPSSSLWANIRLAIVQDRAASFIPDKIVSSNAKRILAQESVNQADWKVDFKYAYHIATVGGARVIHMENELGTLDVGYRFDALMVDFALDEGDGGFEFDIGESHLQALGMQQSEVLGIDPDDDKEKIVMDDVVREGFEKFVMCGDDRNILKVWVDGVEVCSRV